jgi:radical SAM protein with 4Fe4S-binding SPASM domain
VIARKLLKWGQIAYHWQFSKSLSPPYLPEDISIEATNVCNFKCSFCPQSQQEHHVLVPRSYLVREQAEEIMRKLREGGVTTRTLHWTHDGEPFMNKNFHELCAVALSNGFTNMYFSTNGSLLTTETIDRLPKAEASRYTLAIDYCADQHYFERVRGVDGSWKRILDNIRTSLNNPSHEHIFFVISDISSYDIGEQRKLTENFRALRSLFDKSSGKITFAQKTFHNATGLVEKFGRRTSGKRYRLCPYPWTSFAIVSNGDVVACGRDLRRQTILGNILRQSLEEIWRGEPYRQLRGNLAQREPWKSAVCNGCDMPWDDAKFSISNFVKTARRRLQIFTP